MAMSSVLKIAFQQEMEKARNSLNQLQHPAAFHHLERAHVLGQRYLLAHLQVHLWMLRVGWAQRDLHEMVGQITRLLLIPLGHLTRRLPLGNTGGANVSAFRPMPIAQDLDAILQQDKR